LLCEAAAELGDAEGGARLYDELSPYADRLIQWTFTGNAGSAHGPLARAAAVADRVDDACAHFEAAVAHHAELGAPALLARSRCDYGEFLVRTGANAPRGRRLLREAAGTARRLGMSGVAARAARRLNGEDPCSY
jgi:hypothetical protein